MINASERVKGTLGDAGSFMKYGGRVEKCLNFAETFSD
jgi:hypothetical protein